MRRFQQKAVLITVMVVGSFIGVVKGQDARQRWMFKILSKQEEKQTRAVRKADIRKGKIALDDIEMAAFHNS